MTTTTIRDLTAACAIALCVALPGCDRGNATHAPGAALHDCTLPKVTQTVRCGEIDVAENPENPGARRISIAFAVLGANTLHPAPDPLVMLAGGPGQAASYLGPLALQFTTVRKTRDIVLIDQRGTGRSSPLECAAFTPVDTPDAALELDPAPRVAECARELALRGVDASQYTTAAWVEDIDAVRKALGYARINLWGASYGTRAAQEYVRRHPDHVRAMVLDGVAPPSMKVPLDVWPAREGMIAAAFEACLHSAECGTSHTDLKAAIAALDEQLSGGRDVPVIDPRTGEARTLHITLDHVLAAFQALVYVPDFASLLPEATRLAIAGDFAPLYAATAAMTSGISEQVNSALYYAVTCTEDVPRITVEEREQKLGKLFARRIAERGIAACDAWPRGKLDAEAATPLVSNIPTLLLSGGLDPVTPPANGTEVAKTLGTSRHIIAAGYGHSVSPHACAPQLIGIFIEDAAFARLPADCVRDLEQSVRPLPWPDRLGPRP